MIRTENSGDKAAVDKLIVSFGGEHTYTGKLRSAGRLVPEVSLVSEDGNGNISGYIGCTYARAGEINALFITGVHSEKDDAKKELISALIDKAKEQGRDALFVYNDGSAVYKEFRFISSICYDIIPPDSIDDMGLLLCIFVSDKRLDEAARAELPGELGKSFEEPVFSLHTRMTDDEVAFAAMDTRRRTRIMSYVMETVLIIVSVVLFLIKRRFFFLSPAIITAIYMAKTFKRLGRFREELDKLKADGGKLKENTQLIFYDEFLLAIFVGNDKARWYKYSEFHYIYVKKDYMFLGYPARDGSLNGLYVKSSDIPDKEALLSFIKKKSGGVRIMK